MAKAPFCAFFVSFRVEKFPQNYIPWIGCRFSDNARSSRPYAPQLALKHKSAGSKTRHE